MACDANTLMASAVADGYDGLSNRGFLLAMCGTLSVNLGNQDADTTMLAAKAFDAFSDEQLDQAIVEYICSTTGGP